MRPLSCLLPPPQSLAVLPQGTWSQRVELCLRLARREREGGGEAGVLLRAYEEGGHEEMTAWTRKTPEQQRAASTSDRPFDLSNNIIYDNVEKRVRCCVAYIRRGGLRSAIVADFYFIYYIYYKGMLGRVRTKVYRGCSLGKYPTEVFGQVRYGLNTLPNNPVWFGTNSIPVTYTWVSSVRPQYRYPTLRSGYYTV